MVRLISYSLNFKCWGSTAVVLLVKIVLYTICLNLDEVIEGPNNTPISAVSSVFGFLIARSTYSLVVGLQNVKPKPQAYSPAVATLFWPVSLFVFFFAFIFYLPSVYCLAEPPSNINIFAICFVLSCKILITLLMIMWLSFVTHSNTLFHCNLCSLVCWFFWFLTFKAFSNFFY